MRIRMFPLSAPEAALGLGLLLVVFSLAWAAAEQARRACRASAVRRDLRALVDAARRFYEEYGTWPDAREGQGGDRRYGREIPNAHLINILCARDAPGNLGHASNPKRLVFLSPPAMRRGRSGCDAQGEYRDPWGRPYQIVLDTDHDDVCAVERSVYGRVPGHGVLAWSCGPDGISDTRDDILTWKPSPGP